MTDYIPGRIYSGVIFHDQRELFMWDGDRFVGVGKCPKASAVEEVRGPLVVIDLPDIDLRDTAEGLRKVCTTRPGYRAIADQIEEQTGPPLQIGWHEVEAHGAEGVRRWDGRMWYFSAGSLDDVQGWTSVHYIGPGSSDE